MADDALSFQPLALQNRDILGEQPQADAKEGGLSAEILVRKAHSEVQAGHSDPERPGRRHDRQSCPAF